MQWSDPVPPAQTNDPFQQSNGQSSDPFQQSNGQTNDPFQQSGTTQQTDPFQTNAATPQVSAPTKSAKGLLLILKIILSTKPIQVTVSSYHSFLFFLLN